MAAQPLRDDDDDYVESPSPRVLFRAPAQVIRLDGQRSRHRKPPESDTPKTPETMTSVSGPDSGTRVALRDIPGDWASVTAVWTGSPEPLSDMVGRVTEARTDPDRAQVALACWALLVLIPRGLLHLASWVLSHPARLLAAAVLAAIFAATTIL